MDPRASRLGHKSMDKKSVRNLQYGPKTRLIRGIYINLIFCGSLIATSRAFVKTVACKWLMSNLCKSYMVSFGTILILYLYEKVNKDHQRKLYFI